jgi:hypothetical protein
MSTRLLKALNEVKSLPEITLGKIADQMKEEALLMVCLVCVLPFLQPIPLPGISSILGLIVLMQGFSLIFYHKPILSQGMRNVIITKEKFEFIYGPALKFSRLTSRISSHKHPVVRTRLVHIISGIAIILSAGFLSLPLPLPLSNLIPALSILLICVGLMEEDIILILMGYGITAIIIWMTLFSYHIIKELISSWF